MSSPEHGPLIDAEQAHALIDAGDAVALEVSGDPEGAAYAEAHVPGARWAYWKDLLWHPSDRLLAAPGLLRRRLDALDVDADALLVLYGDPVQYGTYAYWVLAAQGSGQRTAVLDGARTGWRARGLPTEADDRDAQDRAAGSAVLRWVPHAAVEGSGVRRCVVGRDDVLAAVDDHRAAILDVRSRAEYRGERVSPPDREVDHGAERAGRIPGARHLPYERFLEDDAFVAVDQLRRLADEAGLAEADRVIAYCRLSHRASLVWFALHELLRLGDVAVYDGSWTEWGSMVGMPVER